MSRFIEKIKELIPSDFFSSDDLKHLLSITPDSRYGLVKRALAKGDIIQLRRGLYVLAHKHRSSPLNVFEVAHKIYSPSYISLESSLSYHGWIPESVPTITSVGMKRSKCFRNSLGLFSFSRIPSFNYIGVDQEKSGKSIVLIAEPTKALIDYVQVYKLDWKGKESLFQSLRIDPISLAGLSENTLLELMVNYKNRRVKSFIAGILKEIRK